VARTTARRVGRYEIVREIGRGGMATVYLARQTDLQRDVALKELSLFDGADPALARRFLREARLAGSLGHPNIVTVYDYIEYRGRPYIAMEYVPGGSLRPHVGRLSLAQIGGVLDGLLSGLAFAEERSILHRDLKPENIMVTAQGWVKIADFGIAKATSEAQATANLTTTGTTLGTPRYMAPERALGEDVGPWSDLYSVGIMAFELLVGRTPFHDTEEPMAVLMRQINEEVPPVSSVVPDVDQEISDWVQRLLVKDPAERTRSAATAWDELEDILTTLLGPRRPLAARRRRFARRHGGDERRRAPSRSRRRWPWRRRTGRWRR
jgi:serine/threonine protein kinase